jgi:aminoglycoside phosphotransferase (APT) family kinase protein
MAFRTVVKPSNGQVRIQRRTPSAWEDAPVTAPTAAVDVVSTAAEAAALPVPPLLVLEDVGRFFDEHGLGSGPPRVRRIGAGSSNVTFLVEREGARLVLRRPPRPPLPPSAHDMLREARLQLALAELGVRVPRIVALCAEDALGQPFYVMEHLDGDVVTDVLPPLLEEHEDERRAAVEDLVEALVEIHAADVSSPALEPFVRPGSFLERQVRRWSGLWEAAATRDIPDFTAVGRWLAENLPEERERTVVHGDFRLGNVMLSRTSPARVLAVLDWEMGAIGDPRTDVGYLLATYSDGSASERTLQLSPVTARPGFPARAELVERYAERSGRDLDELPWFEALALWKSVVFCEAIYQRWRRGEMEGNRFAPGLEQGVPALAAAAAQIAERA